MRLKEVLEGLICSSVRHAVKSSLSGEVGNLIPSIHLPTYRALMNLLDEEVRRCEYLRDEPL